MPSTADAAGTAETAEQTDAADPTDTATDDTADDWYATRWGRIFYWTVLAATLLAVVISASQVGIAMQIPVSVYLFGFLGAAVYAFAHFAKQFERAGRYRLKILSRTVAVLPLSAGVFLLAGVFVDPAGSEVALGESALSSTERLVGGLVFVAVIPSFLSLTAAHSGSLARFAYRMALPSNH
ncbi:hypothetical protein [Halonotius roseus]|uniref:Uncharacterized protein n=1 Tax=Halonotius roseus TaxID=2511997 RepID=A0A544QP69_9EURY|nr:hypothetical protein [Halonotius roseus]TQQ80722.1 hypothetical protein EWF95_09600 [Halonotius roseus]